MNKRDGVWDGKQDAEVKIVDTEKEIKRGGEHDSIL